MYSSALLMIKCQRMWETKKLFARHLVSCTFERLSFVRHVSQQNTVINGCSYEIGLVARSYERGIE